MEVLQISRVLYLVDSSCALVPCVPRFSLVLGRSWTEVGLKSSFCFYLAATLRGRPPRRPFARELAALRSLVRRPTNAAAVTKFTFGLL